MKNSLKKNHYCLCSHVRQWISIWLVLCIFPLALHAQNREITLDLKNVTLENAVTQIASQAKISVAYSKEFVDTKQLVSISVKNATLRDALNSLLKKTNVGYSISGDKSASVRQKDRKQSYSGKESESPWSSHRSGYYGSYDRSQRFCERWKRRDYH